MYNAFVVPELTKYCNKRYTISLEVKDHECVSLMKYR